MMKIFTNKAISFTTCLLLRQILKLEKVTNSPSALHYNIKEIIRMKK